MNHEPKTPLPWPNDNSEPSFALHCDARDMTYAHHAANCYPILIKALKAAKIKSSDPWWIWTRAGEIHNAAIDAALAAAGESDETND